MTTLGDIVLMPPKPSKFKKFLDSMVAAGGGISVFLIVIGVKPVPSLIASSALTSGWDNLWVFAMLAFSVLAGVGALLRTNKEGMRQDVSTFLEYVFWLGMAGTVWVFGACAIDVFGLLNGLTTVGFSWALGFACLANWWSVVRETLQQSKATEASLDLYNRITNSEFVDPPDTK